MTANLLARISECSDSGFSFFVPGKPETQGSKSAFGRIFTDKNGRQRVAVAMTEQSKGLHPWRSSVGRAAISVRPKDWKTDGLYAVSIVFYMPRPKSHFNQKGQLRPGAPVFHGKLGDADKLLRACGDALTKICYNDDSLIVAMSAIKLFCDPAKGPGAHITVLRLHEAGAAAMALALKP